MNVYQLTEEQKASRIAQVIAGQTEYTEGYENYGDRGRGNYLGSLEEKRNPSEFEQRPGTTAHTRWSNFGKISNEERSFGSSPEYEDLTVFPVRGEYGTLNPKGITSIQTAVSKSPYEELSITGFRNPVTSFLAPTYGESSTDVEESPYNLPIGKPQKLAARGRKLPGALPPQLVPSSSQVYSTRHYDKNSNTKFGSGEEEQYPIGIY